jgi:hypothetical protein
MKGVSDPHSVCGPPWIHHPYRHGTENWGMVEIHISQTGRVGKPPFKDERSKLSATSEPISTSCSHSSALFGGADVYPWQKSSPLSNYPLGTCFPDSVREARSSADSWESHQQH